MGSFKVPLILAIILIIELVLWASGDLSHVLASKITPTLIPTATPTPSPTPTPTPTPYPLPLRFTIPKLSVNTQIEYVSADSDGRMGVPQDSNNVGWYSLGFKPGEKGNAVIDGHYDTVTGAPATFYNIGKLVPGDEIQVTREGGIVHTFIVTDVQIYPYDGVPLLDLLAPSDSKNLNLITCEGWFNNATHNYSHRTVVYSTLKE